jgi:hypothetical protein
MLKFYQVSWKRYYLLQIESIRDEKRVTIKEKEVLTQLKCVGNHHLFNKELGKIDDHNIVEYPEAKEWDEEEVVWITGRQRMQSK